MDEGCEVIAAMVPMRGHVAGQGSKPFQPMAWRWNATQTGFDPIHIEDGAVQPIDIIGSGALMFPAYLLEKIKQPWFFDHLEVETRKRKNLDDSLFVRRLKTEGGAQVYVDTTIKITHATVMLIDDTYSDRFPDWGSMSGEQAMCQQEHAP